MVIINKWARAKHTQTLLDYSLVRSARLHCFHQKQQIGGRQDGLQDYELGYVCVALSAGQQIPINLLSDIRYLHLPYCSELTEEDVPPVRTLGSVDPKLCFR